MDSLVRICFSRRLILFRRTVSTEEHFRNTIAVGSERFLRINETLLMLGDMLEDTPIIWRCK